MEAAADCDRATAMRHLRVAIANMHIGVRWSDGEDEADPPPFGSFWKNASIRLDHGGEVLHQVFERRVVKMGESYSGEQHEGPPRYREFLVDRSDLNTLWPMHSEDASPAGPEPSVLCPTPPAIREYARELYQSRAADPPNMDEAGRLICKKLPRAVRKTVRIVLSEPEFANQRRRSGVRRKR